jgi:flagellar assembly protein FliH
MSTSCKPARLQPPEDVQAFPYPEAGIPQTGFVGGSRDEQQRREQAAREDGRRDGEASARAEFDRQLDNLRKNIAAAIEQFAAERREYFLAAEREIVQLALAIARKILRREAQIDPLLLAGMVRVALEPMAQATRVSVRVSPHLVSDFRVFFARHMQERPPEIVEDPTLPLDHCVLHTELGSTEIGPEIQLKEIEQGLLDLQAARPRP